MLFELYKFFYLKVFFFNTGWNDDYTNALKSFYNSEITFGDTTMALRVYLCNFAVLISVIFILVLCCIFVYKIIKLVGGLIRR